MAESGPNGEPVALVEPAEPTPDPEALAAAVNRANEGAPALVEPPESTPAPADVAAAVDRAANLPTSEPRMVSAPPEGTPLAPPQSERLSYNPASAAAIANEKFIQARALAARDTPPMPGTPTDIYKPPTA
jgi:hypothetical protein